jgi:hypothetical protein
VAVQLTQKAMDDLVQIHSDHPSRRADVQSAVHSLEVGLHKLCSGFPHQPTGVEGVPGPDGKPESYAITSGPLAVMFRWVYRHVSQHGGIIEVLSFDWIE